MSEVLNQHFRPPNRVRRIAAHRMDRRTALKSITTPPTPRNPHKHTTNFWIHQRRPSFGSTDASNSQKPKHTTHSHKMSEWLNQHSGFHSQEKKKKRVAYTPGFRSPHTLHTVVFQTRFEISLVWEEKMSECPQKEQNHHLINHLKVELENTSCSPSGIQKFSKRNASLRMFRI